MKTTKYFFMAALALMTAACSNDDNEITQQTQKGGGITITAQLAPKTNGADTRAVADKTTYIESKWAVGELIAILYKVGSTNKVTNAEIKTVDKTTGVATIEFTVDGNTADNTACTLVYPAELTDNTTQTPTTTPTYKDDLSGLKDDVELLALANQDGMLNTNMDVRVGEGTIQTSTPSLSVTTQPAAKFSIFKFTIQDIRATGTNISPSLASVFKVSDAAGNEIIKFTPSSSDGVGVFTCALSALSAGTYWFNATISEKPYVAKATLGAATVAGKFYPTTVKMATVDDVVLSNGKFAAKGTTTDVVAKITYVVDASDATANSHGLALALADESVTFVDGDNQWLKAKNQCEGKTPTVADATWMLPTKPQWQDMIEAAGSYTALANGFESIGGTNLAYDYYWSSSQTDSDDTPKPVWVVWFWDDNHDGKRDGDDNRDLNEDGYVNELDVWRINNVYNNFAARACLEF